MAQLATEQELKPIQEHHREVRWEAAIGASGTISTVESIVRDQQWTSHGITADVLEKLKETLIEAGDIERLPILSEQSPRALIFPGGESEHADLPGFSRQEQELLGVLVTSHRGKFPQEVFDALSGKHRERAKNLSILLRLAVLRHRSRARCGLPSFVILADDNGLKLAFPPGWLTDHPLTRFELEEESGYLKGRGQTDYSLGLGEQVLEAVLNLSRHEGFETPLKCVPGDPAPLLSFVGKRFDGGFDVGVGQPLT